MKRILVFTFLCAALGGAFGQSDSDLFASGGVEQIQDALKKEPGK